MKATSRSRNCSSRGSWRNRFTSLSYETRAFIRVWVTWEPKCAEPWSKFTSGSLPGCFFYRESGKNWMRKRGGGGGGKRANTVMDSLEGVAGDTCIDGWNNEHDKSFPVQMHDICVRASGCGNASFAKTTKRTGRKRGDIQRQMGESTSRGIKGRVKERSG